MAGLFGSLGDGQTVRAVAAGAAIACAGAIAIGFGAERYARIVGPPKLAARLPRPPANAIDYATTGKVGGGERREFVVLSPCGDEAGR